MQRCLDRLLDLGLLTRDGRKHESKTGNAYIPNFLIAEKLGCATLGGQPKSEGTTLETDTGIELGCDNEDIRLRQSLTHKQKEQRSISKLTKYEINPGGEPGPTTLQEPESEKKLSLQRSRLRCRHCRNLTRFRFIRTSPSAGAAADRC